MGKTVLLIEDNAQNRYLVTFMLQKHGYNVVAATDGPHGVAVAASCEPCIILLDIHLPIMNGYEVAQALRSNVALRQVPIVAVTSYAMAGDRERALAAGCDGYLEKPIDPDTFIADLTQFMRQDQP